MLIVKVELHSAITHKITTIAEMKIWNDMLLGRLSNYGVSAWLEGFGTVASQTKKGYVVKHDRINSPLWSLVVKALQSMGY